MAAKSTSMAMPCKGCHHPLFTLPSVATSVRLSYFAFASRRLTFLSKYIFLLKYGSDTLHSESTFPSFVDGINHERHIVSLKAIISCCMVFCLHFVSG